MRESGRECGGVAAGSWAWRLLCRALDDLGDLCLPPQCLCCGRGLHPGGRELCGACRADLALLEGHLCAGCGRAAARGPDDFCPRCLGEHLRDGVCAAAPFLGTARRLVHRFKYRADFACGRVLARLLARRVAADLEGLWEVAVPVPLHMRRLWERGFNPAGLLARDVARARARPWVPDALVRIRRTRPLAGLDQAGRRREVRGAFRARRPELLAGRAVLLVDDVLTTGTTAEECARALKEAGARRVWVAAAARAVLGHG